MPQDPAVMVPYFDVEGLCVCVLCSVPSGVDDAADRQAHELHPCDAQHATESPAEGATVHPAGHGTRVALLQQLSGGAGLPVPLPLHRHRLQLLLFHLPRPRGESGNVSAAPAATVD